MICSQHRNWSIIYLTQTFYKVPQNICYNGSHFCIFSFLSGENKQITDKWVVDHRLLDYATDKKYALFCYNKLQKSVKKNLTTIDRHWLHQQFALVVVTAVSLQNKAWMFQPHGCWVLVWSSICLGKQNQLNVYPICIHPAFFMVRAQPQPLLDHGRASV